MSKIIPEISKYLEKQKFDSKRIKFSKYSPLEINRFPLFPNQFIYVTHINNGTVTNIRGMSKNLGYSDKEVRDSNFLFEIIHEQDKPFIFEAAKLAYEFGCRNINHKDFLNTIFSLSYRVKTKSGAYINILRQTGFQDIDMDNKVITMLSVCTDISHIITNNYIGWRLDGYENYKFDLSHLFKSMMKIKDVDFSNKEMEIIQELSAGLQSKEIAEKLFISRHTVDTHRRNILKKTGLNNTVELVIYAIRTGIV